MARNNNTRKARRPKTVVGTLMSPVNVTKSSDISPALNRIRNAPVTLVLIYANWCGHCHSYMPFFDKMSRVRGRTANTVKIEESELKNFNNQLTNNFPKAQSLEAEGYPTLLAVSREGQVVSPLPVVREETPNTKMIRSVGNIAASIPKPASVKNTEVKTPNIHASSISSRATDDLMMPDVNFGTNVPSKMPSTVISPPDASADISPTVERINTESEPLPPIPSKLVGGNGLYGSLIDATYQLAPAAVLTGIASGIPRTMRLMRKTRRYGKNKTK